MSSKPLFVLAPMDDVTDTVFRQIIHNCAPADLYFTEFVNVDGLVSPGRSKLLNKLKFTESEGPLIAQIWGLNPKNFETVAKQIADGTIAREIGLAEGVNFVGIDLNMGCPAKSEVKAGACSALIKNRPLAQKIIEATKRGIELSGNKLPLSVKTRIGFSEVDLTWIEFLLGFNLDMLTMHWRTRKEMSKVPAHWELAIDVIELRNKISPTTKIIGNGDVISRAEGENLAEKYGLDGVMIGRGVFSDPYVFAKDTPWEGITPNEKIKLYRQHVQAFAETWEVNARPIHTLNKFCKIYVSGFSGAKELREKLMKAESTEQLLQLLSEQKVPEFESKLLL